MTTFTILQAYGMSAWPMDLVKGRRSASKERNELESERDDRQAEIDGIRAKVRSRLYTTEIVLLKLINPLHEKKWHFNFALNVLLL